ncbi:Hypothetical protein SMAX5B_008662 [Scophthalmus maximus]|uniref:Uncharacterized protein n=1 Tax=Scophthalmus maximus TaxID=52904 RepID=A0A2U9CFV1_SCOMX|nr:Hypothetical protein SMAX5B_008662 [Scophthalmus maximus]
MDQNATYRDKTAKRCSVDELLANGPTCQDSGSRRYGFVGACSFDRGITILDPAFKRGILTDISPLRTQIFRLSQESVEKQTEIKEGESVTRGHADANICVCGMFELVIGDALYAPPL